MNLLLYGYFCSAIEPFAGEGIFVILLEKQGVLLYSKRMNSVSGKLSAGLGQRLFLMLFSYSENLSERGVFV